MLEAMALAIYTIVVSALYALIAFADETAAQALVIAFVALLLVPHALARRAR